MFNVVNEFNLAKVSEAIIVGIFENRKVLKDTLKRIDNAYEGQFAELIREGDISGKKNKVSKVHSLGKIGAKRIYCVGLGKEKQVNSKAFREAFGLVFKHLQRDEITEVDILLDTFVPKNDESKGLAHLCGEALALATYHFSDYKTTSNDIVREINEVTVITDCVQKDEVHSELNHGLAFGKGTNTARTLVNTPSNLLTATDLAEHAVTIAKKYGMDYEVLEKEDMEKLGMGALLAVNKGSKQPPKMIVLIHRGKETWEDVIGLVGKGITFDTGGYSLKPKDGIVGMKGDMGGAASVLGAMEVIGELQLKQNVIAVIPSTDNMISGDAFKPDDVITAMSGKTIEVLNTDAEGRLALADGITYAKQLGADYLVDVATLTGGVVVALGDCTTGAMTNHEDLYEQLVHASYEEDEPIWLLPMFERYKEKVRESKMADLNNSPGREAHPIMAGAFLAEFAEHTPWIHLDIAGTATAKKDHALGPSGATGVMVRTLTVFVERMHKES